MTYTKLNAVENSRKYRKKSDETPTTSKINPKKYTKLVSILLSTVDLI